MPPLCEAPSKADATYRPVWSERAEGVKELPASFASTAGFSYEFCMAEKNRAAEHQNPWHAISVEACFERISASREGLSADEAARRLEEHGENTLAGARAIPAWKRFLLQFHNVLIYVLFAAGSVTLLLQHWVDAGVIFAVVIINAVIGFFQEGKAEQALEAIRNLLSPEARVTRGGRRQQIEATQLVPGDVVHLRPGDKVPADLRLFDVRSLRVDESILTGESMTVDKTEDESVEEAALGDRHGMVFSGTLVAYGRASGLVVATGQSTEIGKINELTESAEQVTTPLLRQIKQFSRVLTLFILGLSAATFLFGFFVRENTLSEMFLAVVALAVAAIPEGLPAILTITLAIGVQSMAKRKAIVRRLPAVETLGAVSVICTDKTGTLTRGEMSVKHLQVGDRRYEVTGTGYESEGTISREEEEVSLEDDPVLDQMLIGGILCNDSTLREKEGQWFVEGDPVEGALLALARKAGLDRDSVSKEWARLASVPFESDHKYMATLNEGPEKARRVFLKGAPEVVIRRCRNQIGLDGEEDLDTRHWEATLDELAGKGERMLALAVKTCSGETDDLGHDDLNEGFTFVGLWGLMDPPREETVAAVETCHEAGIQVKMITGDHKQTAAAIGRQIGLRGTDQALSGKELEGMSDEELQQAARDVDVFARTSPEHKLRLVKALQAGGTIVAMTGDGVNDAPALKAADVGVAMGIKGTEAAKEAAKVVLTDDNFSTIEHAIEEGRRVFDNIKKSILFILPTNGGQALVVMVAIIGGMTLPLTPAQILWVNMVSAVTLALSLVFEPADDDLMARPPRNPAAPILSLFFAWRIGFVSVIIMAGTIGVFFWSQRTGYPLEQSRTMAVNVLISGQIFYLFNCRSIRGSAFRRDLLTGNPYIPLAVGIIVLAQLAFTYVPIMHLWFGAEAISALALFSTLGIGLVVFLAVELEKLIGRKLFP